MKRVIKLNEFFSVSSSVLTDWVITSLIRHASNYWKGQIRWSMQSVKVLILQLYKKVPFLLDIQAASWNPNSIQIGVASSDVFTAADIQI